MTERPILFSDAMVRAILDGRKTQTRRVVRGGLDHDVAAGIRAYVGNPHVTSERWVFGEHGWGGLVVEVACGTLSIPLNRRSIYGAPGDLLWVREAHAIVDGPCWSGLPCTRGIVARDGDPDDPIEQWAYYRVGFDRTAPRWRPSIHMPRWASRLTLRVTDVRVERVQAITTWDALAEGVADGSEPRHQEVHHAVSDFAELWDSINGDRRACAWADDPWVWVVSFERVAP